MLVPENDADALHNAMANLLNTPERRIELVKNAHSEIDKQYSTKSLVNTMKNWYGVADGK